MSAPKSITLHGASVSVHLVNVVVHDVDNTQTTGLTLLRRAFMLFLIKEIFPFRNRDDSRLDVF